MPALLKALEVVVRGDRLESGVPLRDILYAAKSGTSSNVWKL